MLRGLWTSRDLAPSSATLSGRFICRSLELGAVAAIGFTLVACASPEVTTADASTGSVYAMISVETSTDVNASATEEATRTLAEVRFLKTSARDRA
ncbi:MAG: hypothetical protein U0165_09870 [Polyangiaceae bacterium]